MKSANKAFSPFLFIYIYIVYLFIYNQLIHESKYIWLHA